MKHFRPIVQRLETRTLLSTGRAGTVPPGPMTLSAALAPSSDPARDGVVFQSQVQLTGQTEPGAVVQVLGVPSARTRANAHGQFHLKLRVGYGTTTLPIQATDALGRSADTDVVVTWGNMVIDWNAVALQAIRADQTPPPVAARALAIVQTSVYDAVNNIDPTSSPYFVQENHWHNLSADAAAAGAAYGALVSLFPQQQSLFNAALAATRAGLPHSASVSVPQSISFGEGVANRILAWRSQDGSNAAVSYTPGTAMGDWQPMPPSYAPALLPGWGNVLPFALTSGAQFLPPGPPALNSPQYTAAVNEVESLGAVNSTTRTPEQTQIALFWSDGAGTETPPGHWNTIAETVALQNHDSLVTDARNFALLDVALADAGIAAWNAKYTYNFWRPVTVIRQGDPANPQIIPDPTWTPLITTPPFPSYVSAHSTFSGAAAAVLSALYGPNVPFTTTSDGLPGVTRSFTSFTQAAAEAGISRIYGGIHYPFDNQDGLALGQAIGQFVVQNVMKPLPGSPQRF